MAPSNPVVNRWLYRCIHAHGHEIKPAIRNKYTEIEQLRLEAGFGCINDPEPGDWNWVPEADIGEKGVSWITVKDRSCTMPSDDEIVQKMSCASVSPSTNKDEPSNSKFPARKSVDVRVGRGRQKLVHPPSHPKGRSQSVGKSTSYQPRLQDPVMRLETTRSGIRKRSSLPSNKMESSQVHNIQSTQPNQRSAKQDFIEHEVEVVTILVGGDGQFENACSSDGTSETAQINVQSEEDSANGDNDGVTWVGLDDVQQLNPILERELLLEEFKLRNSHLPENLVLLTYFFQLPIITYKKKNQDFYKDIATRYLPIVKITMVGKSEAEYNVPFIVDWGSDYNIAPQYGFSKKITRDVVRHTYQAPEYHQINLRWRKEKTFVGSDFVKINLKPNILSSEGKIMSAQLYAKLIVAESFDIPFIILGYTFLRNYIPAVDFTNNHLYLINKNEDDVIMKFNIEEWVMVDEMINRSTNPPTLYLRSSATRLKLYNKPYPGDPAWYPIRNEALEEIAPLALSERTDIKKLDACNTGVFSGDYSLLPEDQRYVQIGYSTHGDKTAD